MKFKKLLSLLVCTLVIVSTLGVFTVAAAADATINVPVGTTYTLPAEVNGTAVTEWKDASGATVTVADTDEFGYRVYTGTTASSTVTYRVNVGELVETFSDDMNAHSTTLTSETAGTNTVNAASVKGGSFTINSYDITGKTGDSSEATTLKSQHFVTEGTNTYLSLGPESNSTYDTKWTVTDGGNGGFKYSFKFKIDETNWNNAATGGLTALQWRLNGSNDWLQLRINNYPEGNVNHSAHGDIFFTGFRYGADGTKGSGTNSGKVFSDLVGCTVDEATNTVSSNWFDVDIVTYGSCYDIYVNDSKVFSTIDTLDVASGPSYLPSAAWTGVSTVTVAKRNNAYSNKVKMLMDDVKFSKLVCYEGDLANEGFSVSLPEGTYGEQTYTKTLTLNNNETKEFEVKYTTVEGQTTADGIIEGFDGVVPVTYSYLPVKEKSLTAVAGATVTLTNDNGETIGTVPTTTIGILRETVETADAIYNYTINVSGYVVKYSDDMENHTNTVWTKDSVNVDTIAPGTANGLTLKMTNNTTDTKSGVIETDGDNQYVKMVYKTPDGNMQWHVDNPIDGDTRVTVRMKASDFTNSNGGIGSYFRVIDTEGVALTHQFALRSYMSASSPYMHIRAVTDSRDDTTIPTSGIKLTEADHGITYTDTGIDWFTLTFDINKTDKTYDVYVNDAIIVDDYVLANSASNGIIGYFDYDSRNSACNSYVDDIAISVIDSFAADYELPAASATAAKGAEAPLTTTMELTTANGLKVYPTVTYSVDTSNIGKVTDTAATVEGFSDTATVNAEVRNYKVAVADSKATLTNISGIEGATAIVAYYGDNDILVKATDLIAVSGDKTEIDIVVPDGAKTAKLFIINNGTGVQPVDLVTEIPIA